MILSVYLTRAKYIFISGCKILKCKCRFEKLVGLLGNVVKRDSFRNRLMYVLFLSRKPSGF